MVHRSESELNFDDIIFAERNKSYGAYDLRNIYNSHLKTAIISSVVIFSVAVASPKIAKLFSFGGGGNEEYKVTEVVLTEIPDIDPKAKPPEPPPEVPPPPKIATIEFLEPKIVEDKDVKEEAKVVTQEETEHKVVSDHTQDGVEDVQEVVHQEVEDKGEIFLNVSEKSEFVGGQAEYFKFLQKHLTFPSSESDNNHPGGKVVLSFVVEKNGTITDLVVLRGLTTPFNEEAKRVIQLTSGKWAVAKNNGVPVRFKKTLVVVFALSR